MICPYCNGAKKSYAFVDGHHADGTAWGDFRQIDCSTCKGTGEVSQEFAIRHEIGRKVRDVRLARGQTLRERAAELGMETAKYSRCEHGIPDEEGDWGKFLGIIGDDSDNTEASR